MIKEITGRISYCPKCESNNFDVEYLAQSLMMSAEGKAKIHQTGENLLLNTCSECGYKELTKPSDHDD